MNLTNVYEKAILDAKHIIENKDKEIERLQNIIKEVEGMLENPWNIDCINQNNYILNKLKELKEGNKDE